MSAEEKQAALRKMEIVKVDASGASGALDDVVEEAEVALFLNGKRLLSFSCLPRDVEDLAAGFLFSEGISPEPASLALRFDPGRLEVHAEGPADEEAAAAFERGQVLGSGCGAGRSGGDGRRRGCMKIDTTTRVSPAAVWKLMKSLAEGSPVFKATGGTHVAGLGDPAGRIVVMTEDIGRHNAVDKVIGHALRTGLQIGGLLLCCSGRISSDIALKAVRGRIPIVVSRSAPTALSVDIASRFMLTLIGFARSGRMNVYSCPERVMTE